MTSLAALVLAAACSSVATPGPTGTSGTTGSPPPSGWASPIGSTSVVPVLASVELAAGPERVLFTLIDQQGRVVAGPTVAVHVRSFDLARDADTPVDEVDAAFFWIIEGERGLYRAPVLFSAAGQWGGEFVVTGVEAAPVTVRVVFSVRAHPSTPAVGEPAPPVDTPTLADAGGDPHLISTDQDPDPRLYEVSVREALEAKQPFLLNFGTPAFCESQTCGPTLQVIRSVLADFPTLTAIHVEPYQLTMRDGSLQPVFDASGHMQPIPAVRTWGLPSEPYTFLVRADGTIATRLEGAIDPLELGQAIEALLAG